MRIDDLTEADVQALMAHIALPNPMTDAPTFEREHGSDTGTLIFPKHMEATVNEVLDTDWRYGGTERVLSSAVAALKAAVDREAERERMTMLTPGEGQAMVYAAKALEASLYNGGAAGDYPLLTASLGIDGDAMDVVAERVLARHNDINRKFAAIERVRLRAKRAIDAAETIDMATAAAKVTWPR